MTGLGLSGFQGSTLQHGTARTLVLATMRALSAALSAASAFHTRSSSPALTPRSAAAGRDPSAPMFPCTQSKCLPQ